MDSSDADVAVLASEAMVSMVRKTAVQLDKGAPLTHWDLIDVAELLECSMPLLEREPVLLGPVAKIFVKADGVPDEPYSKTLS
jgi:hypothetical protein